MDATTQAGWDRWCEAHIQRALAAQTEFSEEQRGLLVQLIVLLREEWRDADQKLREEIGGLRAELEILRSIVAGKTVEI